MDTITQRMKKQMFVMAWHSLSQQGLSPTDKDIWQDFHKLVSTMNFLLGWEGCHCLILPVWYVEEEQKAQTFDRDQAISKSRKFMHLQRTHFPTLAAACKKVYSANTSKLKSFHLFAYKDDFISKWSSNNQCSSWLMSIILGKFGIIHWVNKEKQQLKPSWED